MQTKALSASARYKAASVVTQEDPPHACPSPFVGWVCLPLSLYCSHHIGFYCYIIIIIIILIVVLFILLFIIIIIIFSNLHHQINRSSNNG